MLNRKEQVILKATGKAMRELRNELLSEMDRLRDDLRREQSEFRYCGVYQRAQQYHKGNVVTHSGGMWIATIEAPQSHPGDGSDWQLAVKGGR